MKTNKIKGLSKRVIASDLAFATVSGAHAQTQPVKNVVSVLGAFADGSGTGNYMPHVTT